MTCRHGQRRIQALTVCRVHWQCRRKAPQAHGRMEIGAHVEGSKRVLMSWCPRASWLRLSATVRNLHRVFLTMQEVRPWKALLWVPSTIEGSLLRRTNLKRRGLSLLDRSRRYFCWKATFSILCWYRPSTEYGDTTSIAAANHSPPNRGLGAPQLAPRRLDRGEKCGASPNIRCPSHGAGWSWQLEAVGGICRVTAVLDRGSWLVMIRILSSGRVSGDNHVHGFKAGSWAFPLAVRLSDSDSSTCLVSRH